MNNQTLTRREQTDAYRAPLIAFRLARASAWFVWRYAYQPEDLPTKARARLPKRGRAFPTPRKPLGGCGGAPCP